MIEERTCTARRVGQSVLELLMVIFLPTLWSLLFLRAFLRGAEQESRSEYTFSGLLWCDVADRIVCFVLWLVLAVVGSAVLAAQSNLFSGALRLAEASSFIALGASRRSGECGFGYQ